MSSSTTTGAYPSPSNLVASIPDKDKTSSTALVPSSTQTEGYPSPSSSTVSIPEKDKTSSTVWVSSSTKTGDYSSPTSSVYSIPDKDRTSSSSFNSMVLFQSYTSSVENNQSSSTLILSSSYPTEDATSLIASGSSSSGYASSTANNSLSSSTLTLINSYPTRGVSSLTTNASSSSELSTTSYTTVGTIVVTVLPLPVNSSTSLQVATSANVVNTTSAKSQSSTLGVYQNTTASANLTLPTGTTVSSYGSQGNTTVISLVQTTFVYSLIHSVIPSSVAASASLSSHVGPASSGYGVSGYSPTPHVSASAATNCSTVVVPHYSLLPAGGSSSTLAVSAHPTKQESGSIISGSSQNPHPTSPPGAGYGYPELITVTRKKVVTVCPPNKPCSVVYDNGESTLSAPIAPDSAGVYSSSASGLVVSYVCPSGTGPCYATYVSASTSTQPAPTSAVTVGVYPSASAEVVSSYVCPSGKPPCYVTYVPVPTTTSALDNSISNGTPSLVPVYTPSLLGNAYGGGYITTPSVYVIVPSPSSSGSGVGVPPGYGSSLVPEVSSGLASSSFSYPWVVTTSTASSATSSGCATPGCDYSSQSVDATAGGQSSYTAVTASPVGASTVVPEYSTNGESLSSTNPPENSTSYGIPYTLTVPASPTASGQTSYLSILITLPAPPGYGVPLEPATSSGSGLSSEFTTSASPSATNYGPGNPAPSGSPLYSFPANNGNVSYVMYPTAMSVFEGSATRHGAACMTTVLVVLLASILVL